MGDELTALTADAGPDYSSGVMVALYPPADVAATLALPDGLPPDELHVTLLSLGDATGLDPQAMIELQSSLTEVAQYNAPLRGRLGGIGRFFHGDDDQDPVFLTVDAPGLAELRSLVVQVTDYAGVDYADDHDFVPHMTLTYEPPDAPLPTMGGLPVDVQFNALWLVVGGVKTQIPLGHEFDPIEPVPTDEADSDGMLAGLVDDEGGPVCKVCVMPRGFGSHQGADPVATFSGVDVFAGTCSGPGPCDTKPFGEGKNWVNKVGGLPEYIRAIAHALQRAGRSESQAIQMAIGTVKRWAAGGGKVSAETRARAAKAVAEWEAKKAAAQIDDAAFAVDFDQFVGAFSGYDEFAAWNPGAHPRAVTGQFAPIGQGAGYNQSSAKGKQEHAQVEAAQKMLMGLGFTVGTEGADGKFGPRTRAGIEAFQQAHGLPATGVLDQRTMAALHGAATSRHGRHVTHTLHERAVHKRRIAARPRQVHRNTKVPRHAPGMPIDSSSPRYLRLPNGRPIIADGGAVDGVSFVLGLPQRDYAEFASLGTADGPTHAGIALKAADTGRVLMLQRALEDPEDPAAGKWEFPGGAHEDGDLTSLHTGIREWTEETGQPFPENALVAHTWTAPNGVYQGHVVVVPNESVIAPHEGRVFPNPDDPDGDNSESVAWWHPDDAEVNPALREECKDTPWDDIRTAGPTGITLNEDSFQGVTVASFLTVDRARAAAAPVQVRPVKADTPDAEPPSGATPDNQPPTEHKGVERADVWDDGSATYPDGYVWDPRIRDFRLPLPPDSGDPAAVTAASSNRWVRKRGNKWVIIQRGTGKVISSHDTQEKAEGAFRGMMKSKYGGAVTDVAFTSEDEQLAVLIAAAVTETPAQEVPAGIGGGVKFRIPLLLPTGLETGDRRKFKEGGLTSRDFPMPLFWQKETDDGHKKSVIVARIDKAEKVKNGIGNAEGEFDTGPEAQEALRLIRGLFLRGVSGDVDKVDAELVQGDDGKPMAEFDKARLTAATLVGKPAFAECMIELPGDTEWESNMARLREEGGAPEPLVAAGGPVHPPRAWFDRPNLTEPTHLVVEDDGRVFGHIAAWGTRHIGMPFQEPPRSRSGYRYFATGQVKTAEGDLVNVGQLTLVGGHASTDMSLSAEDAIKHYDDTDSAVADVAIGEDEFGIWVAGAQRPDLSEAQVRAFRASDSSGDWRPVDNALELVACLQVNCAGFPVPRARVASAAGGGTVVTALVAAGAPAVARRAPNPIEARVAALESIEATRQREVAAELRATVAAGRDMMIAQAKSALVTSADDLAATEFDSPIFADPDAGSEELAQSDKVYHWKHGWISLDHPSAKTARGRQMQRAFRAAHEGDHAWLAAHGFHAKPGDEIHVNDEREQIATRPATGKYIIHKVNGRGRNDGSIERDKLPGGFRPANRADARPT